MKHDKSKSELPKFQHTIADLPVMASSQGSKSSHISSQNNNKSAYYGNLCWISFVKSSPNPSGFTGARINVFSKKKIFWRSSKVSKNSTRLGHGNVFRIINTEVVKAALEILPNRLCLIMHFVHIRLISITAIKIKQPWSKLISKCLFLNFDSTNRQNTHFWGLAGSQILNFLNVE